MEFKITLPDLNINQEQKVREMKARFTDDFDKGGILNQVFVFTSLSEPASVKEITDNMTKYYQKEFFTTEVRRSLNRLVKLGLLNTKTSGDILILRVDEKNENDNKISAKFHHFLDKIPNQFRNRYTNMNYFWVSNGYGLEFINHCCKLLNFKCEKK